MEGLRQVRATTSASNFGRRQLCKDSHRMEDGRPEPEDSEVSAMGTLMHRAWHEPIHRENLSEDDQRLLATADEDLARIIAGVEAVEGLEGHTYIYEREGELAVRDDAGAIAITGHYDFIRHYPRKGVVIIVDLKMGFLPVSTADQNSQLMVYAVAAWQGLDASRVYLGILEPRRKREDRLSLAVFDAAQMEVAAGVIVAKMAEVADGKEHPRTASEEACRYCKAKLDCDAYHATMSPAILANNSALTKSEVPLFLANCDDEQMDRIGLAIQFSGMIRDAWKAETKRRIEAGQMAGWELKPGSNVRQIDDIKGAFEALADACNLPVGDFLSACSLSLGDLEKPVKKAAGLKSEAEAKRRINDTLSALITTKQNEPSIKRIK